MGNVFATTSGKGGVGKSTVAVGLALAFANLGKSVLLVDMDRGLRCLDLLLGIDQSAVYDLIDVLNGADIEDATYEISCCKNLKLIPAPAADAVIDIETFKLFVLTARNLYDIVIFDFPAGTDFSLYSCLPKAALFLTVATPDPVSVRDAAAVSERLSQLSITSELIINRYIYKQSCRFKNKNIDNIIDNTSTKLAGIIPESEELLMLSMQRKIKKRGRAMAAFKRIAKRLAGEHILLPNPKKI